MNKQEQKKPYQHNPKPDPNHQAADYHAFKRIASSRFAGLQRRNRELLTKLTKLAKFLYRFLL